MAFAFHHHGIPASPASAFTNIQDARARPPRSLWSWLGVETAPQPTSSPWGAIAETDEIAPGILWFRTAGRSGYKLSAARQRALPRSFRTEDGWYEDGSEWAGVAVVFDRIFERIFERATTGAADDVSLYHLGKEMLRNWRPAEYSSWFQTVLEPDEINALAITQFHRRHADRWIVVDAVANRKPGVAGGRISVRARLGGDPPFVGVSGRSLGPSRWFLIDTEEFTHGRGKPFLIDAERHCEIDEPSATE